MCVSVWLIKKEASENEMCDLRVVPRRLSLKSGRGRNIPEVESVLPYMVMGPSLLLFGIPKM